MATTTQNITPDMEPGYTDGRFDYCLKHTPVWKVAPIKPRSDGLYPRCVECQVPLYVPSMAATEAAQ